ncbi:hypothetical protein [Jannaschia sp. R86511]|uniref:hypothetical protein n=1 Tax=Jannaschia sp. R86511 TaxID=3093853 RepID=UPI0036D3C77F
MGRLAKVLGFPLQAWQQQVADVALEVDQAGEWAYTDVVVGTPRQSGKSTLLGPVLLHRALMKPDARCWQTAQTRAVASDLLMRELGPRVARAPGIADLVTLRAAIGSEGLYLPGNGSSVRPFPPSETGLHGQHADIVAVDETWAFEEARGVALEQAVRPTLATTGGQAWWVSTAGTPASTLLRRLVDKGRAGAAGTAFFDWSVDDDTAARIETLLHDGSDAAVAEAVDLTLTAHPGELVRRSAVLAAATTMAPGEFLRAFANRWTAARESLVPLETWAACRATGRWDPPTGKVAFGVAADPDRAGAVIGAAWRDGNTVVVDVVDERPGTSWVPARLAEVAASRKPIAVGHDAGGPAAALVDVAVTQHRLSLAAPVVSLGSSQYAAAADQVLQLIVAGAVRHPGHPALDRAAAVAEARPLGDRWVWRRTSGAAALEACSAALWALDHAPARQIKPGVPA